MKKKDIKHEIKQMLIQPSDKPKDIDETVEELADFTIKIGLQAYSSGKEKAFQEFEIEEIIDIDRFVAKLYEQFYQTFENSECFTENDYKNCIETISKAFRAGYRKRLSADVANNLLLLQKAFNGIMQEPTEIIKNKGAKYTKKQKV